MRVNGHRTIWHLGLIVFMGTAFVSCRDPAQKRRVWVQNGVEMVVDPAVPLSRDHGRVLELREHLRIEDTGDAFYLKFPANPKIAPDGSVLLLDRDQLLRFSPEGLFLGNLCKPGQGPGEFQSLERFVIEDGEICAFDGPAQKLVRMALDGRWIDDRRVEDWFETMTKRWIVGSLINLPQASGVLDDARYSFFCTSRSDETLKKTYVFLGKFYKKLPVAIAWDKFLWAADAGKDVLFVSHARDYGIEVLDLNEGRVTRSFRRAYPRVSYVIPDHMKAVYERPNPPPRPEFESDVIALYLCGDRLWVRTSTEDPEKGILVDVFNDKGDYLDCFYIKVKGSILDVSGDALFVKETDDDGTISVVLYKMTS